MKRLFRWYVGDPLSPFWVYPAGWRWLRPKSWWYAKCMTRLNTYLWNEKGKEEEAHRMMLAHFLYGEGFHEFLGRKHE